MKEIPAGFSRSQTLTADCSTPPSSGRTLCCKSQRAGSWTAMESGIPYAIGFFLWSGVSAGTAWLGSTSQLILARVMLGVGESIAGPSKYQVDLIEFFGRAAGVRDGSVFQRHQDRTRDWRSNHDLALASLGLARDVPDTRLRCDGLADSLAAADARGRGESQGTGCAACQRRNGFVLGASENARDDRHTARAVLLISILCISA